MKKKTFGILKILDIFVALGPVTILLATVFPLAIANPKVDSKNYTDINATVVKVSDNIYYRNWVSFEVDDLTYTTYLNNNQTDLNVGDTVPIKYNNNNPNVLLDTNTKTNKTRIYKVFTGYLIFLLFFTTYKLGKYDYKHYLADKENKYPADIE